MKVRELIVELLEFNLDATVNIRDMYSDSESINFSWLGDDYIGERDISREKRCTSHVFLEGDVCDCENDGNNR